MMSAVMSSFSEGITFMLQSFRLAFVLPSFIFLSLNAFFIVPTLPKTAYRDQFLKLELNDQFVIILAFSFLLGYSLSIINIWLIRLFEGYHWRDTWPGKMLIRRKRAEKDWWENFLDEKINELFSVKEMSIDDPRRKEVMAGKSDLKNEIEPLVTQLLQSRFPTTQPPFLPTGLGNAIAAFEDYPRSRYGIDAVLLWPRLLPTLTNKKYAPYIERSKAQFDFLINLCFLLLLFSLETLFVAILFAVDWSLWLIISGFMVLFAYSVYKIAILTVQDWGMTVQVAFDLYRHDLQGALFGKCPRSIQEEKFLWRTMSRFLKKGATSRSLEEPNVEIKNEPFDYSKIKVYLKQIGLEPKEKEDK